MDKGRNISILFKYIYNRLNDDHINSNTVQSIQPNFKSQSFFIRLKREEMRKNQPSLNNRMVNDSVSLLLKMDLVLPLLCYTRVTRHRVGIRTIVINFIAVIVVVFVVIAVASSFFCTLSFSLTLSSSVLFYTYFFH